MGLPSIVIETADNQRPGTEILAKHGALQTLGSYKSFEAPKLRNALIDLAGDRSRRMTMSRLASKIVDGCGAKRIAARMLANMDAMLPS